MSIKTKQKKNKTVKIKPLCLCSNCEAEVVPTKTEAGRFLMQFRKTPYDAKKQKEWGKLGGRPRKKKES